MDDSSNLSLGNGRVVHGVTINKLPIGKYLEAVNKMFGMPERIITSCFPDKSFLEILESLTKMKGAEAAKLFENIMIYAPEAAMGIAAEIIGIEKHRLYEGDIGITEFFEIVYEFIEVNDLKKLYALTGKMLR